jgi:hypothetical protein
MPKSKKKYKVQGKGKEEKALIKNLITKTRKKENVSCLGVPKMPKVH